MCILNDEKKFFFSLYLLVRFFIHNYLKILSNHNRFVTGDDDGNLVVWDSEVFNYLRIFYLICKHLSNIAWN